MKISHQKNQYFTYIISALTNRTQIIFPDIKRAHIFSVFALDKMKTVYSIDSCWFKRSQNVLMKGVLSVQDHLCSV